MGCGASAKKYETSLESESSSLIAAPVEKTTIAASETSPVEKASSPPVEPSAPKAETAAAESNSSPKAEAAPGSGDHQDLSNADAADDEEEEEEEDDMDEEEFHQMMRRSVHNGPRKGVSAERSQIDKDWQPPHHEKTPEQVERLKASLDKCFMFSCLDKDQLDKIIDTFMRVSAEPGFVMIEQGAQVNSTEPALFVIESGRLSVYKDGVDQSVFTYSEPGQFFGDLALLYNAPRAATVKTDEDCVLWSIDRDTFNFLVKDAARQSIERRMGFLQSVPLLAGLTVDELVNCCDVLQARHVKAETSIIVEGDHGDELYIVETGKCEASKNGNIVATYEAKDFFGELALLNAAPRACDVKTVEDSCVLVLSGDAFRRLLGPLDTVMKERAESYAHVNL